MSSDLLKPLTHKIEELNIKPTTRMLVVSIREQQLVLFENGMETQRFRVSTGKNPPSCKENSYGTPTGLHRIESKHGDGLPIGAVLVGRVSTGQLYTKLSTEKQNPNLITSRILWLEGLELGHNRGPGIDSHQRYIYIHGTNHEDKIGQPASGGCVQLQNQEMIALFERTESGDLVFIS